jgi:uncharacterized protein YuzE
VSEPPANPTGVKWSATRLEVTYRGGRLEIAYLYVPRRIDETVKSAGCREVDLDMLLEVNHRGELIGIEFLSPELVTAEGLNRVLAENGFDSVDEAHVRPLQITHAEQVANPRDLRVTFQQGRPWVGYLYLGPRGEKSARSRRVSDEMVIDVDLRGCLIGIEFLSTVSLADVNRLLMEFGIEPVEELQLKPILND